MTFDEWLAEVKEEGENDSRVVDILAPAWRIGWDACTEQMQSRIAELEAQAAAMREVLTDIRKYVLGESAAECGECDHSVGFTCPTCTARYQWIPDALKPVAGRALLDEVKRLREIVGKLPKTADGVPVAPGMELFHCCGKRLSNAMFFQSACYFGDNPQKCFHDDNSGARRIAEWCDVYSTRESAQAAKEAK